MEAAALKIPVTLVSLETAHLEHLRLLLSSLEENRDKPALRYGLILSAVAVANALKIEAGFRIDPEIPESPMAFIELPTGQVSFHIPQHCRPWDEHSTPEKYERIRAFVNRRG